MLWNIIEEGEKGEDKRWTSREGDEKETRRTRGESEEEEEGRDEERGSWVKRKARSVEGK